MANIGSFTAAENGYTGSVKTLTLNVKAKFVATEKENDKAPDYRIFAGTTEFGAAWKKTARETEREYLSVKLDDPSFPAPIYASLVKGEGDDGFLPLIWSISVARRYFAKSRPVSSGLGHQVVHEHKRSRIIVEDTGFGICPVRQFASASSYQPTAKSPEMKEKFLSPVSRKARHTLRNCSGRCHRELCNECR